MAFRLFKTITSFKLFFTSREGTLHTRSLFSSRSSLVGFNAIRKLDQRSNFIASQLTLSCGLKTKKAAAKRFRVTGSGKIKFGHCGKCHLTAKKSRKRMKRLNQKGHLSGTNLKNMLSLIPH